MSKPILLVNHPIYMPEYFKAGVSMEETEKMKVHASLIAEEVKGSIRQEVSDGYFVIVEYYITSKMLTETSYRIVR